MPSRKAKVLFLCTGNSARSQMAEGYLRHVAGDEFEPLSAGIAPKALNPRPIFPRTYKFLHWGLDDPAAAPGTREEKLAVFRRVRDEITRRIDEEFVAPLTGQRASSAK